MSCISLSIPNNTATAEAAELALHWVRERATRAPASRKQALGGAIILYAPWSRGLHGKIFISVQIPCSDIFRLGVVASSRRTSESSSLVYTL